MTETDNLFPQNLGNVISALVHIYQGTCLNTKYQDSKVFSKNGKTFLAILTLKALLLLRLKYLQKSSEE